MGDVPGQNQIHMEDPDRCVGCGWTATTPPGSKEITERWLIIPIPNSVVWIYICPKCGAAMGNKNAVENVEKLEKIKQQKIIQARSPLIKPDLVHPGRN